MSKKSSDIFDCYMMSACNVEVVRQKQEHSFLQRDFMEKTWEKLERRSVIEFFCFKNIRMCMRGIWKYIWLGWFGKVCCAKWETRERDHTMFLIGFEWFDAF